MLKKYFNNDASGTITTLPTIISNDRRMFSNDKIGTARMTSEHPMPRTKIQFHMRLKKRDTDLPRMPLSGVASKRRIEAVAECQRLVSREQKVGEGGML